MSLFSKRKKREKSQFNETNTRAKSWRELSDVDYDDRLPSDRKRVKKGQVLKITKIVCAFSMLILFGFGVKHYLNRHILDNPDYSLVDLLVKTDGYIPRSQIVREAKLPEDVNLLLLKLEEVKERIESLPQVKNVNIQRELPGVLKIEVNEYKPIAWIECKSLGIKPFSSKDGYLIDDAGVPFPCLAMLSGFMKLPVIKMRDLARVKEGKKVLSDELLDAVKLVDLNKKLLFKQQLRIRSVEPSGVNGLLVTYGNDSEILYSRDGLEKQLKDFGVILEYATGKGFQIKTLDMMVKVNRPITFFNDPNKIEHSDIDPSLLIVGDKSPSVHGAKTGTATPVALGIEKGKTSTETKPIEPTEPADVKSILGSLY